MKGEGRKLLTGMALIGGAYLIMSSYWVEDNQTAVNRRYVGLISLGLGVAFR